MISMLLSELSMGCMCFTARSLRSRFAYLTFYTLRSRSGAPAGISSRLIPRSHFTSKNVPKLVDAIQAGQKIMLDAGADVTFQVISAPPTKRGTYNAPNTSINPIWYESLWHVVYGGESPP
jgi:hypothetical protein